MSPNEEVAQKDTLRVAAVQMVSTFDYETNVAAARRLLEKAKFDSAELAVLPENFLTYGSKRPPDEHFQYEFLETFQLIAKDLEMWVVAGSFPLSVPVSGDQGRQAKPRKPCATTVVFHPKGRVHAHYSKLHLFDAEVPDANRHYRESDCFSHGDRSVVFESPWGRIGLAICYDLRFPELFIDLVQKGAELILVPSAFTETTGRDHWEILLRVRAVESQCFVVAPNQGGRHTDKLSTWGRTMIVDPWGEILSSLEKGEGVVVTDLDLSKVKETRDRMPIALHRRIRLDPKIC